MAKRIKIRVTQHSDADKHLRATAWLHRFILPDGTVEYGYPRVW